MAVRFYLTATAAPYTPTTKRGAWDNSAATLARYLGPRPAGTATTAVGAETSATNNYDVLWGRWVSDAAVAAGTLSGTVEWIAGVLEAATDANAFWHVHIYVTSGDTDTVRGTLLTDSIGATEFPTTTAAGRGEGAKTVTSVAISVGDRIVVELGFQNQNTITTSRNITLQYGGTGTTDRASGNTTAANPGWVEFSGADRLFAPLTSSVIDTFSGGTLTDPPWGDVYGGPDVDSGQARVPAAHTGGVPDYAGIQTVTTYRFDTVSAKVTPPAANGATVNCYAALAILDTVDGTSLHARIDTATSKLRLESNVAYFDAAATELTYSPTDHAWLRIRRSGANVLWDTSANGFAWTTRRTLAAPSWTNYGGLAVAGEAARDGGTNSYAYFDNVGTDGLAAAAPTAHTNQTPASADLDNGSAIATGVRFTVATSKTMVGIIFRPPATNTGTYTGQLWRTDTSDDSTGTGTLLASQAIDAADITTGGWARIPITATALTSGVIYTAVVHSLSGRYVATSSVFLSGGITGGGMTLIQSGTDPIGSGTIRNGVYIVNATPAYPTATSGGSNYFIDGEFTAGASDVTAAVALSAGTSLTSTATATTEGAATLGAGTALAASAELVRQATAALSAGTSLTTAATPIAAGAVSLGAATTVTAAATPARQAAAALSAATSLTADATPTRSAAAALGAATTLTAAATPVRAGSASLGAATSLTAAGVTTTAAGAALTSATALTVVGTPVRQGAAALTAATAMAATGTATASAAAALTASTAITVAGTPVRPAAAALGAAADLTTAAQSGSGTSVSLVAGTSLTAAPIATTQGQAVLQAGTVLAATGVPTRTASAALGAATELAANAAGGSGSAATLTAGTSLTSAATPTRTATAALAASTAVQTSGTTGTSGTATLGAATALTVAATAARSTSATLTASADLTTTAGVIPSAATVSLTAGTSLAAGGTATRGAAASLTAETVLRVVLPEPVPDIPGRPAASTRTSRSRAGGTSSRSAATGSGPRSRASARTGRSTAR